MFSKIPFLLLYDWACTPYWDTQKRRLEGVTMEFDKGILSERRILTLRDPLQLDYSIYLDQEYNILQIFRRFWFVGVNGKNIMRTPFDQDISSNKAFCWTKEPHTLFKMKVVREYVALNHVKWIPLYMYKNRDIQNTLHPLKQRR